MSLKYFITQNNQRSFYILNVIEAKRDKQVYNSIKNHFHTEIKQQN